MKTKFIQILTLLLIMLFQVALAQQTVSGTITDANGLPLPGATVVVKGTSTGTNADFDGNYSITATIGDVLVVSYVGYNTFEITVNSTNENVSLTSSNELDEVIITAYGTSTKESFTGSASVVKAEDLAIRSVTSPIAAIEGRATGVQFTSTNGQPGSSPGIIIRGVGTLNGDASPLYIVDGVQYEGSLNVINQEDIESFTILKDASSTALYGSRAANGVVMITTKKGAKDGGIKVSASLQSGYVSRAIPVHDRLNPGQYYETMWEALRNSTAGGGDPVYASNNIYGSLGYNPFNVPNDQIVGTDGKLNPNAQVVYKTLDWFDFMEQTGQRQNYNVNVSGGGKNSKTYFSASYLSEEGYVTTSSFERLTTRLSSEFDANENIKLGGTVYVTLAEASGPSSAGSGSIVNPFGFAQSMGPIYPVYVNDQLGNIVRDVKGNPVFDNGEGFSDYGIGSRPRNQGRHALQELLLNNEGDRDNTYGFRFFSDVKLYDGLNLKVNYGRDINDGLEKEYENAIIGDAQPDGRFSETRFRRDVITFNQILTYSKTFDNHSIDLTAGHESYDRRYSEIDALATIETVPGVTEFDNFSNPVRLDGFSTDKTLEGYFLRANYSFDDKYYLSGSFRRDGSSVFEKNQRWGNFFSVGAAWRIDQEAFMQNVSFVDQLKLRSSYGEVGNDDLNDFYLYQARFGITSNAGAPGFNLDDLGNNLIQWETVENFDVALEFALFDYFLEGSIEYYKKNSTDLLYDLPLALSYGVNVQPNNIADMYNSGWEVGLTGHLIENNNFKWDATIQASTFKNEITSIPEPFINGSKRWAEGRSRFDFFIYQYAGVDSTNGDALWYMFEDDENGNRVPVLDANGNHATSTEWDEAERNYTGDSTVPDLLGSVSNTLTYKGFTLDFLITFGIGGSILDYGYASMMSSNSFGRSQHPDILNAWRSPGDITDVPRLQSGNNDLVQTMSDRFLTDASFWSLKNVNLGYNFNQSILDALGVDNLRLSIYGENLFLKSKRKGLDPQYNLAGTPSANDFNPARTVSLGLNVTF